MYSHRQARNGDAPARARCLQNRMGQALPKEQTAAIAMLDERHPGLSKPPNVPNSSTLGSICGHNIVISCLPKGKIGTSSAATVGTHMVGTFPAVRFGLMVGIGGGVPPEVRLGKAVVSGPVDQYPGDNGFGSSSWDESSDRT